MRGNILVRLDLLETVSARGLRRMGFGRRCAGFFFCNQLFPSVFALDRDLAQTDVIDPRPYQASRNDRRNVATRIVAAQAVAASASAWKMPVKSNGNKSDLGKPPDSRKLDDACGSAGNHEQNALRGCNRSQLRAGDKGTASFKICRRDDGPHADGQRGHRREVRPGAHGVKAGVEHSDLVGCGAAEIFRNQSETALKECGYTVSCQAHRKKKQCAEQREEQPSVSSHEHSQNRMAWSEMSKAHRCARLQSGSARWEPRSHGNRKNQGH